MRDVVSGAAAISCAVGPVWVILGLVANASWYVIDYLLIHANIPTALIELKVEASFISWCDVKYAVWEIKRAVSWTAMNECE